jgi:hypothetical protein
MANRFGIFASWCLYLPAIFFLINAVAEEILPQERGHDHGMTLLFGLLAFGTALFGRGLRFLFSA